jgi:hypothetical protein
MLRAPIRDPTTREHQKDAGMAGPSLEHRIRADLVRALHRKHLDGSGTVDIEHIARENGVSQDQVEEQFNWLREQNLVQGPMDIESDQVAAVPADWYGAHSLTDLGRAWAEDGYPPQ